MCVFPDLEVCSAWPGLNICYCMAYGMPKVFSTLSTFMRLFMSSPVSLSKCAWTVCKAPDAAVDVVGLVHGDGSLADEALRRYW